MKRRTRQPARLQRSGLVYLDIERVERQRHRVGMSRTQLADQAQVSRSTVLRLLHGDGVFLNTAQLIAAALGYDDVNDLLSGREESVEADQRQLEFPNAEWSIASYLGPWVTASNELQYRHCRLQHRYIPNHFARGKCYDLLDPATRTRENLQEHLLRHPTICARIGPHPHLAENLSTFPGSTRESWWVVDRWVDGVSLESLLADGPIPHEQLPHLMRDIAQGLEALHAAGVVFRELAPQRVLLTNEGTRAVLTDFELGKLLEPVPTVSSQWPEDPYRAPEVEVGNADERSDFYSWARILLHAATGHLPAKGEDAGAVTQASLPKRVWRLALDCLSLNPQDRPRSAAQLSTVLRHW